VTENLIPNSDELFPTRPDKKGPKTIAIILIMGSILMIMVGFEDIQNSNREDFKDAKSQIENYQNLEVNITEDEYQDYHDEVRESGAYSVRGYSLLIGGVMVLIGGVLLYTLRSSGAKLSTLGSSIGLVGGFYGSWMMSEESKMLPDEVAQTFEFLSYICGTCMLLCFAMSILPLVNASARLALDQKVVLEEYPKTSPMDAEQE
tara:strand:- start:1306 stop:1917 length:612 start_codon:yes stop_codon:yes gene_type:complete